MSDIKWRSPSGAYRGIFVKFSDPGDTVEGVVTFLSLTEGSVTYGDKAPQGMVQLYDPSVGDQGEGHGFYRRIDLGKKALVSEIERCMRDGLAVGSHLQVTFVENMPNLKDPKKHPWKKFRARWAEPTMTPEEVDSLVRNGRRSEGEDGSGNGYAPAQPAPAQPAPAQPAPAQQPVAAGVAAGNPAWGEGQVQPSETQVF